MKGCHLRSSFPLQTRACPLQEKERPRDDVQLEMTVLKYAFASKTASSSDTSISHSFAKKSYFGPQSGGGIGNVFGNV